MASPRDILERMNGHPGRTLVQHGVGTWSFQRVREDALRARERLQSLGVLRGMRVAVQADTSYDWVVADLALQSLEVSVMGIPSELASESPGALAERFDLSLLLTDDAKRRGAAPFVGMLSLGPEERPRLRAQRRGALPDEGGIYFSSGSTGIPKCVVVRADSFDGLLAFLRPLVPEPSADSLLMFLSYSGYHSRAYTELAMYLGMDVCLATAEDAFDAFAAFRPSVCHAPPVFYESVARRIRGAARGATSPSEAARQLLGGRTRLLFTGMSPIAPETLQSLHSAGIDVFNAYGSMEGGMVAACLPGHNRIGSVGRPLRPKGLRLADDGEIIVTREHPPSVGYLDDSGELVPFEIGDIATGDIGRIDEDGYLWIVGRKKNLIITASGLKVQPEMLEGLIEANPNVRKAVVFGEGQPALTAVVSAASDDAAARASIEGHIAQLNAQGGSTRPRIERLVLTTTELSVENGLLTPMLFKPNRQAIHARFVEAKPAAPGEAPRAADDPAALARMVECWERVLGASAGADTNFFDAGGSSLLVTQLATEIERGWGRSVAVHEILASPTPRALIARMAARGDAPPSQAAGMQRSQLVADVEPDVREVLATPRLPPRPGEPDAILLSGSTGFIGAHILHSLLELTPYRVRCVVRGQGGAARLEERLRFYRLECDARRIEVLPGDLSRPLWGLTDEALAGLRAVIHSGAEVNFLYPYERLRGANVGGTREAARLARRAGVPLHHVSTLSVLQRREVAGELDEASDLELDGPLFGGYPQTKWAAEHLLRRCAAGGLDCSVYRPGEVLANSVTGQWNPTDFVSQVLAAVAHLGLAPDLDATLLAAPVDFVGRAVALFSSRPREETRGGCFHLASAEAIPVSRLFEALRANGQPVEVVPVARWIEVLERTASSAGLPPALLPVFKSGGWSDPGPWVKRLSARRTHELLAKLACRPPDPRVFLEASARAAIRLRDAMKQQGAMSR